MEPAYLNLLRLFHAGHVEYVVVGGYAVIAHGYPRTTGDLDIFVNPTPANARRVVQALHSYGFTQGEFEEADFTTIPHFLSFSHDDVWIDLLTDVRGVSFAECMADALVTNWEDLPVQYLSLTALRKAKAATGRHQDLLDLENLPSS